MCDMVTARPQQAHGELCSWHCPSELGQGAHNSALTSHGMWVAQGGGEGGDLEQGGQIPGKELNLEPSATYSQQHPWNPRLRGVITSVTGPSHFVSTLDDKHVVRQTCPSVSPTMSRFLKGYQLGLQWPYLQSLLLQGCQPLQTGTPRTVVLVWEPWSSRSADT